MNTLILFARQPAPGRSKTRLIPALGADIAAQLSAAFLSDLVARLGREMSSHARLILAFDPPGASDFFANFLTRLQLSDRVELLAQSGGDLGERLAAARLHAAGNATAFIGSDAPDISVAEIERGFEAASKDRAYIQRAHDGGYVLLTLPPRVDGGAFQDIRWSSEHTAGDQIARIRKCGTQIEESNQSWWDVDEPQDLPLLRTRLERSPLIAPLTLALLRTINN